MLEEFKFHHIGVVTDSIEATSEYYKDAGFTVQDIVYDSIQNTNICFLAKEGFPMTELIEPVTDTSPVANILRKNGVSPYHFCYEVENIYESVGKLKNMDFILLNKPVHAAALRNRLICFLFNKNIGLIELVQL